MNLKRFFRFPGLKFGYLLCVGAARAPGLAATSTRAAISFGSAPGSVRLSRAAARSACMASQAGKKSGKRKEAQARRETQAAAVPHAREKETAHVREGKKM